MDPEPRSTPSLTVTVALVAFGVALGSISLYLGIVVGSRLTRQHHQAEVRRLRGKVRAMSAELDTWRRDTRPRNRNEET
jgi:uncharacterized membrane protein YdjX (TVP38/TMEM64 family)